MSVILYPNTDKNSMLLHDKAIQSTEIRYEVALKLNKFKIIKPSEGVTKVLIKKRNGQLMQMNFISDGRQCSD